MFFVVYLEFAYIIVAIFIEYGPIYQMAIFEFAIFFH